MTVDMCAKVKVFFKKSFVKNGAENFSEEFEALVSLVHPCDLRFAICVFALFL